MAGKPTWRREATAEIVRAVEAETAPWRRPRDPGKIAEGPHNPETVRAYCGANAIIRPGGDTGVGRAARPAR